MTITALQRKRRFVHYHITAVIWKTVLQRLSTYRKNYLIFFNDTCASSVLWYMVKLLLYYYKHYGLEMNSWRPEKRILDAGQVLLRFTDTPLVAVKQANFALFDDQSKSLGKSMTRLLLQKQFNKFSSKFSRVFEVQKYTAVYISTQKDNRNPHYNNNNNNRALPADKDCFFNLKIIREKCIF